MPGRLTRWRKRALDRFDSDQPRCRLSEPAVGSPTVNAGQALFLLNTGWTGALVWLLTTGQAGVLPEAGRLVGWLGRGPDEEHPPSFATAHAL